MRQLMLGMSQQTLADAIGLTFQQVQKYEKGTNRMRASRLQQAAHVLQVAEHFFFEGAPSLSALPEGNRGGTVARLRVRVHRHRRRLGALQSLHADRNAKMRHRIVDLVEQIAGGCEN